jgi:hypothetical protein
VAEVATAKRLPARILTRREMDAASLECMCGRADCPNGTIRGTCHPDAGCRVVYQADVGQIVLFCTSCHAYVARIQVAGALPS